MERIISFRSFDGTLLEGTYHEAGGNDNVVAVLVHGINSDRNELGLYSDLAEHLTISGIPSFRFDYRCHGSSSAPIERLTLAGIANDIDAATVVAQEQSGVQRVHLVGMSFGGGISAYWAASTSIDIASVVMLAPVIDYLYDVLGQHGAIVNGRLQTETAEQLATEGFVEMDEVRYGAALINELPILSGIVGLRQLRCKSLIIHGDADSIVPYALSERFATLNAGCRLVNIPGTDHGFGVENDEELSSPETKQRHREVFKTITDFYKEISP